MQKSSHDHWWWPMCILNIYSDGSELLVRGNNKELFVLQ